MPGAHTRAIPSETETSPCDLEILPKTVCHTAVPCELGGLLMDVCNDENPLKDADVESEGAFPKCWNGSVVDGS